MSFDRGAYASYIDGPEWAATRQRRLEHDGWRCTGCGGDGSLSRLEVHHLTYERIGYERLEDLVTLCNLCHAREHGRAPLQGPIAGPTLAELADRAALIGYQRELLMSVRRDQRLLWKRLVALERVGSKGGVALRRNLARVRAIVQSCTIPSSMRLSSRPLNADRPSRHLIRVTSATTEADACPQPSLSDELRAIEAAHIAGFIDASSELEAIRRRIAAAEAKVERHLK